TPPAHDTVLDGITRRSLLTLAHAQGIEVVERRVALDDLPEFTEAFACGTAAVVVPVATVRSGARTWRIGNGDAGEITRRLHAELVAIQEGRADDRFGWRTRVGVAGARQTDATASADRHVPRPDSLT